MAWHCYPVWLPSVAKAAVRAPVKAHIAAGRAVRRTLRAAGLSRGGARATWRVITVCTWVGAPVAGAAPFLPPLPGWLPGIGPGGVCCTGYAPGHPEYAPAGGAGASTRPVYASAPVKVPEPGSLLLMAMPVAILAVALIVGRKR